MAYDLPYSGPQLYDRITPSYAGIHVHDNSTPQLIPTGATYTKLTCFTDNSDSIGSIPDADNDKITIDRAGKYKVNGSFSLLSGTANVIVYATVFVNDVEFDNIHFQRKIATAGDVGSASFSGIIDVPEDGLDVDVRTRHNNGGGVDITVSYANFNVLKIG